MPQTVQHDITVIGAPSTPAGYQLKAHPRLPIEELITNERQFALYVQAIDMMMNTSSSNMLLGYRKTSVTVTLTLDANEIGGIHGLPSEPWDNVHGGSNSSWKGYCTHSSILFPTWHRAYVLLFEQALVGCAMTIAERYKGDDAGEWMQAAVTLRSPYWDWASNPVPPDAVIKRKTLTVSGPNGSVVVLDPNPLLGYTFNQDNVLLVDPDDRRPHTVRCPNVASAPNVSIPDDLTTGLESLSKGGNSPRARVWATLKADNSWEMFSNNAKSSRLGSYTNSLEGIHDSIHVAVAGHMGSRSVAAFDPLFWLHHTNVDRILALWQTLHPNIWLGSTNGEGGTFTINRNAKIDESTDLTPFWNGATTFFKSSDPGIRQWQLLNYDYPEFAKLPPGTDVRAAILAEVKRLYADGDDAITLVRNTESMMVAASSLRNTVHVVGHAQTFPLAASQVDHTQAAFAHSAPDISTTRLEWFTRIRVQAGKVGSSFTVLIFVGEPPEHERDWRTADNLIGSHAEFVNSHPDECSNCQENAEIVTEGFVGLTGTLRRYGLYTRPEPEIEKFLSDGLEWRVQKIDATIVAPDEVPGLEIAVMTVPLEFSSEYEAWMKPKDIHPVHRNLTSGRAGGRPLPHQ